MLDFWASGIENPTKLQLDVLNQVACDLDMADIRWMILRANIVMLHYTRGVEVGDERSARLV